MKSFFKIICAIAISFFCLNFAHAQVEAVKTDDVLKLRYIVLTSVGNDISDGASVSEAATIKIDASTGERTYISSEKTLRVSKLFALLQRNKRVSKPEESYNILPQNLVVGEKWKFTETQNTNRCGRIKIDYDAAVTQGPEVVVIVKGAPVTLKTIEITHEGTWYTSNCGGSGRSYQKFLFSPELKEFTHREVHTYDKGFLYNGTKTILESVN